jgi:hypothetical protein
VIQISLGEHKQIVPGITRNPKAIVSFGGQLNDMAAFQLLLRAGEAISATKFEVTNRRVQSGIPGGNSSRAKSHWKRRQKWIKLSTIARPART